MQNAVHSSVCGGRFGKRFLTRVLEEQIGCADGVEMGMFSKKASIWGAAFLLTPCVAAFGQVKLPLEVMGADGTVVGVAVLVGHGEAASARKLWMQVHGLEYAGMASVRVNQSDWVALSNSTVEVEEPGLAYGGVGGGFSTLKMNVALAAGVVRDGENRVEFRFNGTNGVSSGFRVLAFNFVAADGVRLVPESAFMADDPESWVAPLPERQAMEEGERLWRRSALRANNLRGAPMIRAHCGDCHAEDGRDLKYFNYSNASIEARAQFHGLTAREGEEIASYIRGMDGPHPGRPWDPPYQPGPGMKGRTVRELAAGAGLSAVLADDREIRTALYGGRDTTRVFAPDGELALREIPIAMELPDWNHWLPQVHPLDAWGAEFTSSDLGRRYDEVTAGTEPGFFVVWLKARTRFFRGLRGGWSAEKTTKVYATMLWQLVKTWEFSQEYGLEGAGHVVWRNTVAAATAPAAAGIPNDARGMGGSGLTNEYFSNAWYELQMVLNGGGHRHQGRDPVDWVYIAGHERALQRLSGVAEPGRVLVTAVAAMQQTDRRVGPEDKAAGWRPDQMLDPRMIVADDWRETFAGLTADERRAIAEGWVRAWLDKSESYAIASYFHRAQLAGSYVPPKELRDVSGGKVWEAAEEFRRIGMDEGLVERLLVWGRELMRGAALFQY
jgi:hypothetical protein